jgi:hypothetical protein
VQGSLEFGQSHVGHGASVTVLAWFAVVNLSNRLDLKLYFHRLGYV